MLIDLMKAEPWRFDFFHTLRQLERSNPDRPRIGDSAARREEYVDLGQVPYLEFPASNLAAVDDRDGRLRILVKFLGLLGPQGALPLAATDESLGWWLMRDDAFLAFSTSLTDASCSYSFAPGPMRGRLHSTTGRRRIASSPMSAPSLAWAPTFSPIETPYRTWRSSALPGWSRPGRSVRHG